MEPILTISNVYKKFRGNSTYAVHDFSLTVNEGEIMALLGESGCGKTTILRMIAGFETPDSGTIRLAGLEIVGDKIFVEPEKRGVGIVFQDYALFPNKTVKQNVAFGLFALGKDERNKRVDEALRTCGLEGFEERYPHQLSGGQRQRVALARALAPRPKVLLFDEPFSNIDTLRKAQMRADIGKILRQTKTTAIFVTHDTRDVLSLADHVAVIKEGECQQAGTPSQVYRHPVNSYVARFFGKTNLLEGDPVPGGFQTNVGFVFSKFPRKCNKQRVLLSLRPEDLEVCSPGHAGCFFGKIMTDNFLGNTRELTVQTSNNAGKVSEILLYLSPEVTIDGEYCTFRQKDGCEPGILDR